MSRDDHQDHAYFQAIEETFIRLRGAPLLLSPADWQVARDWRRRGLPLDLVLGALERLFEDRRARGKEDRVSSLRYCAPAVEQAWREVAALEAPGRRRVPERIDLRARLARLAEAIPRSVPGGPEARARVRQVDGDAAKVEERLGEIDRQLLQSARAGLGEEERQELDRSVERRLARLARRLPQDEVAAARERLEREVLRRQMGLPVLSLFASQATTDPAE